MCFPPHHLSCKIEFSTPTLDTHTHTHTGTVCLSVLRLGKLPIQDGETHAGCAGPPATVRLCLFSSASSLAVICSSRQLVRISSTWTWDTERAVPGNLLVLSWFLSLHL